MGEARFFLKRDIDCHTEYKKKELASELARYALRHGATHNAVVVCAPYKLVGTQVRVVWDTDGIDLFDKIKEGLIGESGSPVYSIEYAHAIA